MNEEPTPINQATEMPTSPQQDVARYAVVYSALGTSRIIKHASTQLGAIRHALTLVEWLTDGSNAENGIKVTLDGARVEAAVRDTPTVWTLVLQTEKGRRARGRLSIYREVN